MLGELDRVAEQVVDDLADAHRIAAQQFGDRFDKVDREPQALALRGGNVEIGDCADQLAQAERDVFDDQLACLDLREIEDVVHDRLHVLGTVAGEIEMATLGFVEPALVEQVEQAEKPGKRCAQFVAHVREEFALRVAGRFGAGALLLQLDFGGLALADVLAGPHYTTGDIFRVDRLDRQGTPERHSVAPLHHDFLAHYLAVCQARRSFGRNALIGVHSRVKPARTETGHQFRLITEDGRHLAVYRLDATIFRIGGVDVGESDR